MAVPNFLRVGLDHFQGEDTGEIRLDGEPLPGLLQRMSIRGRLKLDQSELMASLGISTTSQPLGFQAAVIHIELALPSDGGFLGPMLGGTVSTSYDKLEALEARFAEVDGDVNAKVRRISNRHVNARGIGEVWFTELSSQEGQDDVIIARIVLTQRYSPDFKARRRALAVEESGLVESGALLDEDSP